ncbi:MAG TPA: hypothetical protein VNE58_01445, partial [Casimicrobiaceae bacterium]|nr:hypothetical protein [Casimicrobiaceae bacterium]
PPPPPAKSTIVEYFHATFNHYFITNIADEIAALDSGKFVGWARTNRTFSGYSATNGFVSPVCRFFTIAFPPKSSHFYTGIAAECASVRGNSAWTYEGEAFWVHSPDTITGNCPTGTQTVWRMYNNGMSGAPNHRYTVDPAIRLEMLGKGWIAEGFGPEGVAFCAPL